VIRQEESFQRIAMATQITHFAGSLIQPINQSSKRGAQGLSSTRQVDQEKPVSEIMAYLADIIASLD
jgi:hypothetical protein